MSDSTAPGGNAGDPLIGDNSALAERPTLLEAGPVVERLGDANRAATAAARARLTTTLSISFESIAPTQSGDEPDADNAGEQQDPATNPALGIIAGWRPPTDILDVAQQVVAGSNATGRSPARLVFREGMAPLSTGESTTPEIDGPSGTAPGPDLRRPGQLVRRLDEGWTLEAEEPIGLAPELHHLLGDLETAFGSIKVTFTLGLRTALGPPPTVAAHGMLFIQLAGSRSLLVQSEGDQHQLRLGPGQVVWLPPGWAATHLPLDADTAHLTVTFSRSPIAGASTAAEATDAADGEVAAVDATAEHVTDASAVEPDDTDLAMLAPRVSYDLADTRAFFGVDPAGAWSVRWGCPGGVFVLGTTEAETTVAAGGQSLTLSTNGVRLIESLAQGQWTTSAKLATELALDPAVTATAIEELVALGLVTVAPANRSHRGNAFLNGVARGISVGQELVAALTVAIRADAWRSPRAGELSHHEGADVAVQPLDEAAQAEVAHLVRGVATLNAQFFGAEITGLDPEDPPLMVRVRPSPSEPSAEQLDALGSDLEEDNTTRKLTWVVPLSDSGGRAIGGWFVMPGGSDKVDTTPGELSVFPSFRTWMLASPTAGERTFLLGRIHGPAFL